MANVLFVKVRLKSAVLFLTKVCAAACLSIEEKTHEKITKIFPKIIFINNNFVEKMCLLK